MTLNIQELQESLKNYTDQKLLRNNNSATNTINPINNHTGQNNNLSNRPKKIINKKIIVESKTKEELQIENSKKNTINVTQNEIKKDGYTEKEETKGGFFEIPTNKKREFDENDFEEDSVEKLILNIDDNKKAEDDKTRNKNKDTEEINDDKKNHNLSNNSYNENTDFKMPDMQGKI
jgi:hypothetical protein